MEIWNLEFELKKGFGKVKEYNDYFKLKFEREYLNGIRNGNGKEYYYCDILEFEGEYKWKKN